MVSGFIPRTAAQMTLDDFGILEDEEYARDQLQFDEDEADCVDWMEVIEDQASIRSERFNNTLQELWQAQDSKLGRKNY